MTRPAPCLVLGSLSRLPPPSVQTHVYATKIKNTHAFFNIDLHLRLRQNAAFVWHHQNDDRK